MLNKNVLTSSNKLNPNSLISILDNKGYDVVDYNYDVWGKLLTTIGTLAKNLRFNKSNYFSHWQKVLFRQIERLTGINRGIVLKA